ncbi:PBP1A family penicillin-binding protein [Chelativorans sp. ZYF759]|uniref:PBP1A family penicillin-binding protein n=1 Tax=Chelativorans sp. ZYF759 TaxID=2692213 RepID=UPI001FEFD2E6|nr:PBP1A family penicillin-binding protein [Chelativorans sp. ZYF759]
MADNKNDNGTHEASRGNPLDKAGEAPSSRPRRRGINWVSAIAVAALISIVAAGAITWWALRDVPWQQIADGTLRPVVLLENASGDPLVQSGPYQGAHTPLEDYPDHLVGAVLAIEDRRFFDHYGIDLRGITRAFVRNIGAGQVVEGGSTITQQLVKVLYLEQDRTLRRKVQETFVSFWLEARLGKEEILTRYLNSIYLGAGATGVPAAARVYFDKDVSDLTLEESALIAGVIRAPSVLNPRRNPDASRQRAAVVIDAMRIDGRLTVEEAYAADLEGTEIVTRPAPESSGSWFADWAMEEARDIAGPYRGTIRVQTTHVPELQEIASEVVREAIEENGETSGATQAALVAMAPDGAVLAMVGGVDYGESSFNRAVAAMRQPGSTFKLFVYYAALEAGIDPNDLVIDEPVEVAGWAPENFGGQFYGQVTVADAFARSLNAATVSIAETVGIDQVAETARTLGIDSPLMETPSLALGTSEVSLLDLTGAYASIRSGIAPTEPWAIASFSAEQTGRPLRVGPARMRTQELGASRNQMVDMMRLVVDEGTGRNAATGSFAAGKTGTSQNFRDAWFVGFSENWVVGVWVGNDDGTPMNRVTGGGLPAEIFSSFVHQADARFPDGIDPLNHRPTFNAPLDEPQEHGSSRDDLVAQAGPSCDVQACSRRYRSFRASDCTYQPYSGGRRMCDIGAADPVQSQAQSNGVEVFTPGARRQMARNNERTNGAAGGRQGAAASCNVQACSRAYRSFRAADCTYQPYRGPRRMCQR